MRDKLILPILIFLFFGSSLVLGFNEADVKKLKDTRKCVNCDLTGADLSKLILVNGDISGSNLTNADLRDANLHEAKIDGVVFEGANFGNATWIDGCECESVSIGKCDKISF